MKKLILAILFCSFEYASYSQCFINSLTAVSEACVPATNTYTTSGSITFTNVPTTGTLTVSDCHGGTQVFNAPFIGPQAYSISGIPADGAACNITAKFSADTLCVSSTNYTAPASCAPTSISEIENKHIQIYPNPSTGIVYIDIDSKLNSTSVFLIFSISGKLVGKIPLTENSQLFKPDLQTGIYFYSVFTDNVILSRGKLVIN